MQKKKCQHGQELLDGDKMMWLTVIVTVKCISISFFGWVGAKWVWKNVTQFEPHWQPKKSRIQCRCFLLQGVNAKLGSISAFPRVGAGNENRGLSLSPARPKFGIFFNHEWLDPGSLKYLCLTQLPEARGRRLTRGPNWQTGKDKSSPHPRFQLWHFAKVHFFGPKRLIFSGQTKI